MNDSVRLTLAEVRGLAERVLRAQGFAEDHVAAIAQTVTIAERDACPHHGLFRLPAYVRTVAVGQASGDAQPTFDALAPGVVRVDAHSAFAPLALERGIDVLAGRARSQGIAALVVNDAFHIAALWPEVERLGDLGLVGLAFVASGPYVAPAGGTRPLFGTNPMAFAWPRPAGPPLVFDQASSASARGEIQLRLRDGEDLPEGWAIGPDGRPTTDPATALAGAQLPFGGVKGSSIALMIELLAGPLIGDLLSVEAGEADVAKTGAPRGGELVIAIDPLRCLAHGARPGARDAQLAHGERLFSMILEQEGTRLPSDRRYAARARTAIEGVEVPRSLYETLEALAVGRPR